MTMLCRGVRGATAADENTKEAILEATTELLQELAAANDIDPDYIAGIWLTTTPDLNAEFPAVAARIGMGWTHAALMSGHEMAVPDAQERCIRALILLNTEKKPEEINFVYLRGAVNLRGRQGRGETS